MENKPKAPRRAYEKPKVVHRQDLEAKAQQGCFDPANALGKADDSCQLGQS